MSKTELQILSLAARPQGIRMGDPEFHALGTNRIRLWFNLERSGYISSEDDGPYRLTEKGISTYKSEMPTNRGSNERAEPGASEAEG